MSYGGLVVFYVVPRNLVGIFSVIFRLFAKCYAVPIGLPFSPQSTTLRGQRGASPECVLPWLTYSPLALAASPHYKIRPARSLHAVCRRTIAGSFGHASENQASGKGRSRMRSRSTTAWRHTFFLLDVLGTPPKPKSGRQSCIARGPMGGDERGPS